MEHENFVIEIEGQEAADLYPDLLHLEVELDDDLAGMFRLTLAIRLQSDGVWTHVDDERLRIWKAVTITAGFQSGSEELIAGYITHVRPSFPSKLPQCTLEIWGMDGSVLMDQEEKLKDWPNKKDSDIAAQIFQSYGFSPEVENTELVHDEAVSTIIQRETDIQFLRRLARRNGFECYVEGTTGYFRPPQIDDAPQPLLAAHAESQNESTLSHFSVEVNALAAANVSMFQIDRTNKEVLKAVVETSQQTVLGDIDAAGLLPAGLDAGQVYVGMNVATGTPEMTALCQGLFQQAEWFVTANGQIAANDYGHVLRPRGTVTIKGVGETHSGVYYVSHVTHSFDADGYSQSFTAKRNGLLPTGTEDFSGSSGGILGGLV